MPRIPAARLESIKRDVPVRAVLEARGAVFTRHGPDVVCRCVLGTHADETPSFVVSERKNLWRCHGCGEGGDVIKLVQALHGVSFRHAVELLTDGAVPAMDGAAASAAKQSSGQLVAVGAAGLAVAESAAASSSLLGAAASGPAAGPGPAGLVQRSTIRRLPCPLDVAADDAGLLDQVVRYYARRLDEAGNAGRAYLAQRGLDHGELIRRFSLGFADRSLGLRLPEKNRKDGAALRGRLEGLGLFRASGHEHFAGSIVMPIHGAAGAVVSMYGRKVTAGLRAGTPDHLYLAGKHRGVWNWGPDLVDGDGRVVICEALLDAASVWVAGVRSVTAAYGVHGWTDDHDVALRQHGARTAVIAFDADAAGDAGAATLADRLLALGLSVFRVRWPGGVKDANEMLTHPDMGGDAIAQAINAAAWVCGARPVTVPAISSEEQQQPSAAPAVAVLADPEPTTAVHEPAPLLPFAAGAAAPSATPAPVTALALPAAPCAGVAVTMQGADALIVIGSRTYRLRGLVRGATQKSQFDTMKVNLRVSVAASGGDRLHVDTLDLYQARMRAAFALAASQETGLAADVVRADLGQVLLTAEIIQTQQAAAEAASAAAQPDPVAAMTAERRAAALGFLRDPLLLDRVVADLGRCGLVGEADNKAVAYLAAVSRLLSQPLAVVVQSSSAAGKSTLIDAVLSLLPAEAVRQYSAISGKSPFYLGTAGLKHRVLSIAEEEGARRASYALKLLQSDGKLSMAATGKDPETGKLTTHDYTVEGPVALFLTTTAVDVDPELLNRCLVLTVDESVAQTAAIQHAQRSARTLDGLAARRARAATIALHHDAQRLLRPLAVVNPWAERLTFADGQTRLRRDHQKYLVLIDAIALLHQHQREIRRHTFADGTTLDYIEATPADVAVANRLATAVLGRSLDDLPPPTRKLYDALTAWTADEAAKRQQSAEAVTFTRRQAQAVTGWTFKQIRTHLDRLVAEDGAVLANIGRNRVAEYRLVLGMDVGRLLPGVIDVAGLGAGTPAPARTAAHAHAYDHGSAHVDAGLPMVGPGGGHTCPSYIAKDSTVLPTTKPGLPMIPAFAQGRHAGVRSIISQMQVLPRLAVDWSGRRPLAAAQPPALPAAQLPAQPAAAAGPVAA